MSSIFNKSDRDNLIIRIKSLNKNDTAQWGKMNINQMILHCIKWDEMSLGKVKYKRTFLGKLFGKFALPDFIQAEIPFKKNVPTLAFLKIKQSTGDFLTLQSIWIKLVEEYNNFDNDNFTHPFFGKLIKEQLGILAYKHTDHHLRQFAK